MINIVYEFVEKFTFLFVCVSRKPVIGYVLIGAMWVVHIIVTAVISDDL